MSHRIHTETKYIGDAPATLTIDIIDGQILDTKVEINNLTLCWVAGNQRQEFIDKLNEIINEYRI